MGLLQEVKKVTCLLCYAKLLLPRNGLLGIQEENKKLCASWSSLHSLTGKIGMDEALTKLLNGSLIKLGGFALLLAVSLMGDDAFCDFCRPSYPSLDILPIFYEYKNILPYKKYNKMLKKWIIILKICHFYRIEMPIKNQPWRTPYTRNATSNRI